MRLNRIFAVSGIVLGGTAALLVAIYLGWYHLSGSYSKCEDSSALHALVRVAMAKDAADAAARRAEAEKTGRARELALQAAQDYEEAKLEASRETKAKSPAEKDRRASPSSSCS